MQISTFVEFSKSTKFRIFKYQVALQFFFDLLEKSTGNNEKSFHTFILNISRIGLFEKTKIFLRSPPQRAPYIKNSIFPENLIFKNINIFNQKIGPYTRQK